MPHRRWNPLLEEWVLVSPHRTQRPWQGAESPTQPETVPYDPTCYLCPGNTRATGAVNPPYTSTFVFPNDFAALLPESAVATPQAGLFRSEPARGECRVLCFSPRHDLTLAHLEGDAMQAVVDLWIDQYRDLADRWTYVQIFENKGEIMGCSNPHPHGQVWAGDFIPSLVERELATQSKRPGLLAEIVAAELDAEIRVIAENEEWLWWVPFWAVWPFESMLAPRRPVTSLAELSADAVAALTAILPVGLKAMDRLFGVSFPYSMGWHHAPRSTDASDAWHLHAHFYPPLLRSAQVKKFMVGYEMLAEPQRDMTPELAAARLREGAR